MKLPLLLVAFLACNFTYGQFLNLNPRDVEMIPCDADPSVTVLSYINWQLYQTVDDTWNGARYQGSCPSLILDANNGFNRIDLSTIDPNKAFFLAYVGPETELEKNNIYGLISGITPADDVVIRFDDDCTNGMCSGLILNSRHYNEQGTDTLSYTTYYPYTIDNQDQIQPCYNTEKTDINTLISAVYKLNLEQPSDKVVTPGGVFLDFLGSPERIEESSITIAEQNFDGTEYQVGVEDLVPGSFSFSTFLVMHNVAGLSTINNQSFTELVPEIAKDLPTPINIQVDYGVLQFQRYSHLIGAFVDGTNTDRHPVNINFMTDQCLFSVELIGTGGTNFCLAGGNIEFSDKEACIQVRDNSAIKIKQSQQAYLGRSGIGNVNIRSGGSIVIEKDAELIFGGNLIITDYGDYKGEEKIHIDLKSGGHLAFTQHARILNKFFGNELFLYIYMNGGTIDLTKLSQEDRAKIILVYPEQTHDYADIKLFPNPATDRLTIYNEKLQTITQVELYNFHGQRIYSNSFHHSEPTFELDLRELPSGFYSVRVRADGSEKINKLVID